MATLGYEVRAIELRGCLHLKSACTALDVSELQKAEAGLTCMRLMFEQFSRR